MNTLLKYKSYKGTVNLNKKENFLYGKVIHINDLISYEGKSMNEIEKSFKLAIEDYIETCLRRYQ